MSPPVPPGVDRAGLGRAARGSALNLVGSVASGAAGFALTVAVTRLTTPVEAGVFFAATSLFLIVTGLGRLGTDTGLVFFLSGARARGELRHAGSYMRVAAWPVLATSVLLGTCMVMFAGRLAATLSPGAEDRFADYVATLGLLVPAAAVLQLAVAATRGLGTMRVSALVDQVSRPVAQLVLVVAALKFLGPAVLAWAWAAVYLPLAVVAWTCWRRLRDRGGRQLRDRSFRPARDFWRFSWPRALAGVTQQASQRLDILLVAALAGLADAAVYTAVTRFVILGQLVGRAVSLAAQPLLGESLALRDVGAARLIYQTSTAWLILVTWPLYLTVMLFASTFLRIFDGPYAAGTEALVVLVVVMLLATACGMVNMVLLMAGKSLWNLVNLVIAFSANLLVDLILVPRVGLIGAAVGWAVGIALINTMPLIQLTAWFKLHPFGPATLRAMVTALLAFALLPGGIRLLLGDRPEALALGLILAALAYALMLYRQRQQLQLDLLVTALLRRGRPARRR